MLKGAGMSKSDRESVLELLMDVSGAADVAEDSVAILKSLNFLGKYITLIQSNVQLHQKQLQTSITTCLERMSVSPPSTVSWKDLLVMSRRST